MPLPGPPFRTPVRRSPRCCTGGSASASERRPARAVRPARRRSLAHAVVASLEAGAIRTQVVGALRRRGISARAAGRLRGVEPRLIRRPAVALVLIARLLLGALAAL